MKNSHSVIDFGSELMSIELNRSDKFELFFVKNSSLTLSLILALSNVCLRVF